MTKPLSTIKNTHRKFIAVFAVLLTVCTSLLTHAQQQPIRTTTFLHHDASGSVVAATNEAGEEIWRKNYKPYGEQQAGSDQTESVSYTGHTHDKDLGLTYMKARYYDPQAGRFIGLDPVGVLESVESNPQMFNRYAYANNNPFAFTDPDGGSPKGRGDGGSSAAAGALVGCMIGNCNPRLSRTMAATAAKDGNYAAAGSIALNGGMNSKDFVKMVDKTQKKKGAGKKQSGRSGKQTRLKELGNDPKLGKADRGWIKQEQNSIARGNRKTIRNPPGKDLSHERGREAAKGYDYKHSNLQDKNLHRSQHKYDNFGRKNKERPPK